MGSNIGKQKKQKRSLFFPIIKFTLCLVIIGTIIYYVVPSFASKQREYVSIAKKLMNNIGRVVERNNIKARDVNTTYYIPASCVEYLEKQKTPFGDLNEAYVIVTYNGSSHKYYWISKDSASFGVKQITSYDELSINDIKSNIDEIRTDIGIDERENIVVYNNDCSSSNKKLAYSFYNSKTGLINSNYLISYENQQNYKKISVGDEIVIGGKEHFYVISTNKENTTLLAKYNLYAGYKVQYDAETGYKIIKKISKNEKEYGIQSSKTTIDGVGVVPFASEVYWNKKEYNNIYNGSIYNSKIKDNESVVNEFLDKEKQSYIVAISNNYSIAYYLEPYIEKIEKYGVKVIEGRLLTNDEAIGLNCSKELNCQWDANDWLMNTSFWLGSVNWNNKILDNINTIDKNGNYSSNTYNSVTNYGIRPVIVIDNNYLFDIE